MGCPNCFNRTVRQPKEVEGFGIVPRGKSVRRLRDDRNTTLQASVSPGIGLEIGGESAKRSGDNVCDEIFRRLMIKCGIRNHDVTGSGLEWLLLRLDAQQKWHQVAQQPNELRNV